MPGHVYAQVGMFDEAVNAFLAVAAKEREYMSADPQYSKVHYVHNELLLLHVLGSRGSYQEAMSHIAALMSAKDNPAERETAEFFYRVGWFALMKTLVRFEKWNEILDGKTLPFIDQPFESIWYYWARGLAYASTSNVTAARDSSMLMGQVIESIRPVANPFPHQFEIAHSELDAYIDTRAGRIKEGLAALDRSAKAEAELPYTDPTEYPRPVLELLGRASLDTHEFRIAESAYRRALEREPGGGRALWGLAKAFAGLGKNDQAQKTLQEFRQVWRGEELK
jgi:tetratricopeptide (TPR) repeat protein